MNGLTHAAWEPHGRVDGLGSNQNGGDLTDRRMGSKLNFWLSPDLYERVMDKARREAVNVSALLRSMLTDWVEGRYAIHSIQDRTETE